MFVYILPFVIAYFMTRRFMRRKDELQEAYFDQYTENNLPYTPLPIQQRPTITLHPNDDADPTQHYPTNQQIRTVLDRVGSICEYPHPQRCTEWASTATHIIPPDYGGGTTIYNLYATCPNHNGLNLNSKIIDVLQQARTHYFPEGESTQTGQRLH